MDKFRNTLILWNAGIEEPIIVDKACCSIDIIPTLLNLFGLEFDSRMYAGRDISFLKENLDIYFVENPTAAETFANQVLVNKLCQFFCAGAGDQGQMGNLGLGIEKACGLYHVVRHIVETPSSHSLCAGVNQNLFGSWNGKTPYSTIVT